MRKTAVVRPCPCQGGTLVRFVQPIILSILSEEPSHGYAILQKIGQTRLWKTEMPDPAGVYRTLKDMEERGLIASTIDVQGQTERKLYSLTDEGRNCRESWLDTLQDYRLGISEVISALDKAMEM